jgi:hypothetical protein
MLRAAFSSRIPNFEKVLEKALESSGGTLESDETDSDEDFTPQTRSSRKVELEEEEQPAAPKRSFAPPKVEEGDSVDEAAPEEEVKPRVPVRKKKESTESLRDLIE